jgi:hypothetical protein
LGALAWCGHASWSKLTSITPAAIRTTAIAASATIPAGTYFYIAPQDLVDVSAEYRFTRWLSVYGAVRNLTQSAKFTRAQGPDTPDYAQNRVTQRFGALFTMGVKGQF